MNCYSLLLIVGLLVSVGVSARQVETIKGILVSDFSVEYTNDNSFEMDILQMVLTQPPIELEFERRHVSLSKAWCLMSQLSHACVINVLKMPEREKIVVKFM